MMATLEALLDTREIRCTICLRVVKAEQLTEVAPCVCGVCLAVRQVQSVGVTSTLSEAQEEEVIATLWRVYYTLRGR